MEINDWGTLTGWQLVLRLIVDVFERPADTQASGKPMEQPGRRDTI